MGLKTAEEFLASLRDGRALYYKGKRVPDVTAEPDFRPAVDVAALDYRLAHEPEHRDLTLAEDPETGEPMSAFYRIPRSAEHLLARSQLIELGTERGFSITPLIKEIGSDALFALLRLLEGEALERAQAFHALCRREDLAVAVAQTDVKGDRSLPPHQQPDPDHYLRVVDRNADGIVVRGAKAHTSASPNAHYLITLPTRAMGPDDADYALSFAVPANAPGLSLYVSSYGSAPRNAFEHPLSSRACMLETLTVFDDVFVPWERVFLCGETAQAGLLALGFVEYHRFTAVSYKLPLLDAMVGAALGIAEMNGVARAGHIRDKLTQIVGYAETVRGLTEMAALRARVDARGIAAPDPMTTNLAKYTFATGYHHNLALVQECAGGLLVTGPGRDDWESPDVRPVLEKYLAAKAPAAERLALMNLIGEMTARDFAGYHAVLAVHAEGSVEAEKMQIFRSYDAGQALRRARRFAGLDD